MPQQFALYPDLTARENVDFVASLFGVLWRTRHRRTREVLQLLELWDVARSRAGRLSGGMQRRLELACALVHDPCVAVPRRTHRRDRSAPAGHDLDELHRLRDDGRTLLVTTQYVNEAEECDAVALISDGRLIANGPPTDLRRQAIGGDVVTIETASAFDASALRSLPTIVRGRTDRRRRRCARRSTTPRPPCPRSSRPSTTRGGEVVSARRGATVLR